MAYFNGFVRSKVKVADGEQLTVGAKAVLTAGVDLEGNATAIIRGTVLSNYWENNSVTMQRGNAWDIAIESTAVVTGAVRALNIEGNGGTLTNAGRLFANGSGVVIQGENNDFRNSGAVEGETGVSFWSTGLLVNEAAGTITGDQTGIASNGSITNFGSITGGVAISLHGRGAELVNKGEIFGNIQVQGDETVLDMRGGRLSGVIRHEGGSAVVFTDSSDLRFVSNGWNTTVNSSVDYTLGNGVQKLVLTGTADLGGKGNGSDNQLVGNDGKNILQGMQGMDVLKGGAGDDTLTGGGARDVFVFATGDGHDIITDFRASDARDKGDIIDLRDFLSWQDRDTFLADHVRNDQGNVILEFENQSITLLGIRKAELNLEDFQF